MNASTVHSYRFRAECTGDVITFMSSLRWLPIKKFSMDVSEPPDVEVSLVTTLTLETLREILSKIEDGHVMLESLDYEDGYTGDRYYFEDD